MNILNITCKESYKLLLKNNYKEPISIIRWCEEIPRLKEINYDQWEIIFNLPNKTVNEIKIMSFQYKCLHRVLNCKEKLKQWKLSETDFCNFCGEKDTLIHFLITCYKPYALWKSLTNWWNKFRKIKINLKRNDIIENLIFGFMANDVEHKTLNFITLYAKYYIYANKQFNKNDIDFYKFLIYLNHAIGREIFTLKELKNKKDEEFTEMLLNIQEYINP